MNTGEIVTLVGVVIAALTLLVTLVMGWTHVVAALRKARRFLGNVSFQSTSRRAFLGMTAAFGAAVVLYLVGGVGYIASVLRQVSGKKLPKGFVQNSQSGVLHHISACADHLPVAANRSESLQTSNQTRIHQSKKIHIAEVVAKRSEDEMAVPILIDAIKDSPTSTHLYKYLIGIWGKRKEYDRIHEFLAANIQYLRTKLAESPDKPKAARRYSKALQELEQRRSRAEYLARLSKLTDS